MLKKYEPTIEEIREHFDKKEYTLAYRKLRVYKNDKLIGIGGVDVSQGLMKETIFRFFNRKDKMAIN